MQEVISLISETFHKREILKEEFCSYLMQVLFSTKEKEGKYFILSVNFLRDPWNFDSFLLE